MSIRKQQEENFRSKRNAKHGTIQVNREKDSFTTKTEVIAFDKFFLLVNGWEKIIIAAVLSLFLCIPVVRYYSESTTLIIVTLVAAILLIFPVIVYLYVSSYYKSYVRVVQVGPNSISGWNDVIGSLSAEFWKGKNFAAIKIDVSPEASALPKERKRLFEFCSAFANEGSKILSRATLTHFTLELQFLVGKQSAFVIRKIFDELVTRIDKNGKAIIEITFIGEVPKPERTSDDPTREEEIIDVIRERQERERYLKE